MTLKPRATEPPAQARPPISAALARLVGIAMVLLGAVGWFAAGPRFGCSLTLRSTEWLLLLSAGAMIAGMAIALRPWSWQTAAARKSAWRVPCMIGATIGTFVGLPLSMIATLYAVSVSGAIAFLPLVPALKLAHRWSRHDVAGPFAAMPVVWTTLATVATLLLAFIGDPDFCWT